MLVLGTGADKGRYSPRKLNLAVVVLSEMVEGGSGEMVVVDSGERAVVDSDEMRKG